MTLEINLVAIVSVAFSFEKMVESYFEQSGYRGISRDVSTYSVFVFIGLYNHSHSIPTNHTFYKAFNFAIAWVRHLFGSGYGVDVRCVGGER